MKVSVKPCRDILITLALSLPPSMTSLASLIPGEDLEDRWRFGKLSYV